MTDQSSKRDPFSTQTSDPRQLAGLVSLAGEQPMQWSEQELAAMWKHQLAAPLTYDLGSVSTEVEATITSVTAVDKRPLAKFADLFNHPRPPIEILQWTKDFAKAQTSGNDGMPSEVAIALYYASILLARLRCGRRISDLDDAALRRGVEKISKQPWLDQTARDLFAEGVANLSESEKTA